MIMDFTINDPDLTLERAKFRIIEQNAALARVASEPTDSTVIVDPAGLKYIQTVAAAAGGAAGIEVL